MVGQHKLAASRAHLSPGRSKEVLAALARIDGEREPPDATFARQAAYRDRAYSWQMRLEYVIGKVAGNDDALACVRAMERSEMLARLLEADLAIRLYQHERGALPQSLDDLVPAYLPVVPIDPYSERPLKYRPTGPSFVLYSVGYDLHDNGGAFVSRITYLSGFDAKRTGFDFDLDTLARP